MYDESYQVSDGDTVQTPKLGFAPQHRISIKSTVPESVVRQKSASQSQLHPQNSIISKDKDNNSSPNKGNLKFIKRPSTCVTSGGSNFRPENSAGAGITRSLETSRATFRVYSAANNNMNSPAERPGSRNGSGKTRPITPDEPENAPSEEEDDEEDDDEDDEYDNANRDNEESFENIESIKKREFPDKSMEMDMEYTSSEDESVSLISDAEGDDDEAHLLQSRKFSILNGPASTSAVKISNLIPEDLFDALNESTEDDNEEESLRNYFTRQHFREIQLDSKREEIKRRLLTTTTRSCNPHSIAGAGVLRHGYWMYNPSDYENLKVSQDVKDVFQFITKYVPAPVNSQVDVKLKPFIPEYYPSVGDIDAFIKVAHPEVKNDTLGIKYLDEPSAFQSDPSVLDLRLRALAKQSSAKAIVVKKVENVSKNSKIIENWINDISDLHRSKPSPSVHYSKPMPDIDLLLQEWPPEVEDLLKNISFPLPDLDCDLATYVDIVCNLLDIPVYKSRIQSLHVLCTLYATHKNFSQYGGAMGTSHGGNDALIIPSSTPLKHERSTSGVDRLEL